MIGRLFIMSEKRKRTCLCPTCGKPSTKQGHLCSPIESPCVCQFCGAESVDSRHLCFSKIEQLRYVCEECGRVSVSRSQLCAPRQIPKEIPTPKGKNGKVSKKIRAKASAKAR
jgi:hypothetical protein